MDVFELKTAYNELRASIAALNVSFIRPGSDNRSAFIAAKDGPFLYGDNAIALASRAFEDIFYDWGKQQDAENSDAESAPPKHTSHRKEQKDGRETPVWMGAIGVDHVQLELAREVNRRKDAFQEAVHRFRLQVQQQCKGGENHAYKTFRNLLSDEDLGLNLGLVSLRQAYRHIPLLDITPASIRFSFSAGGRSIKRMTIQQALDLIEKKGWVGENIEAAKEKLNDQKTHHVVAQVQQLAGYFKANVTWPKPLEGEPKKQTIPVFLPILYLKSEELTPKHQPHPPLASKPRLNARVDKRLEAEPFLKELRLYAYKESSQPAKVMQSTSINDRSS